MQVVFLCREHSSVGLERLLDKQEVSGSNPLVPTNEKTPLGRLREAFLCPEPYSGAAMNTIWIVLPILIVLMFFGRLGIMTISVGFMAANRAEERVSYAETKIMIG